MRGIAYKRERISVWFRSAHADRVLGHGNNCTAPRLRWTKAGRSYVLAIALCSGAVPYIMPPIPPMPGAMAGMAGVSSFFSAMTHSVVRNIPAMDAAFSRATRVTFAGSMTPET